MSASNKQWAVFRLKSSIGGHHDENYMGKINVKRVAIDRQGYTRSGEYYGVGAPLFQIVDAETGGDLVDFNIRAGDAAHARSKISEAYPGAIRTRVGRRK